jgi:peptide deformylase
MASHAMTSRDRDRLPIVLWGSAVLHEPARDIEDVTGDVRELVRRMFTTMYAAEGQGLAAPQVGVARRLAIVDVPPRRGPSYVLVNPRVVAASTERSRGTEGCLSLPGVWGVVGRPAQVIVEAQDLEGAPLRLEATGELARCLQHEIDHLDGLLYVHHLSPLARRLLLDRYRKQKPRGEE